MKKMIVTWVVLATGAVPLSAEEMPKLKKAAPAPAPIVEVLCKHADFLATFRFFPEYRGELTLKKGSRSAKSALKFMSFRSRTADVAPSIDWAVQRVELSPELDKVFEKTLEKKFGFSVDLENPKKPTIAVQWLTLNEGETCELVAFQQPLWEAEAALFGAK